MLCKPTGASAADQGVRPTINADFAVAGKSIWHWAESPAPQDRKPLRTNVAQNVFVRQSGGCGGAGMGVKYLFISVMRDEGVLIPLVLKLHRHISAPPLATRMSSVYCQYLIINK